MCGVPEDDSLNDERSTWDASLLTAQEVAGLLRVTPEHVRVMVGRGQLDAIRLSDGPRGHMRFRRSALTRWLGPQGAELDAVGRDRGAVS